MLNIDKSKWKPVVKEEDKAINKLKVELLESYKEFYETTGDKNLLHFLEQSFELILDDKEYHRKRVFKITEEATFELCVLGWYLCIGDDVVVMDGVFDNYIETKIAPTERPTIKYESPIEPKPKKWYLF